MPGYVWIYNNRQDFEYVSRNTLCEVTLQVNEYLLRDSEPSKLSAIERFEKIIIVCPVFCKISFINSWECSEWVSGFKFVRVLNIRKLLQMWQGSKYASECSHGKIVNIPGFRAYKHCKRLSICQNLSKLCSMTNFWTYLVNVSQGCK